MKYTLVISIIFHFVLFFTKFIQEYNLPETPKAIEHRIPVKMLILEEIKNANNEESIDSNILSNENNKSANISEVISENNNENNTEKLNTIKYNYFEYSKKIKSLVDNDWDNLLKYKNFSKDLEVLVLLKINKEGKILGHEISGTSGDEFFDLLALKVFKDKQLPQPPIELLNGKDYFLIQWGFAVTI